MNDPKTEDELSTGERQQRLPGDVGAVRDQEVTLAPIADLPFSLTPPDSTEPFYQPAGGLWGLDDHRSDFSKRGTKR